ncbi:hypothetical protein KSX_74680 [Ktedonospora formicarum]|uniref:Uncharacterized protein n=1 Tax=Ktedonospora formicarum TaxID=2778364 RepID=A0A8J3I9I5_9CHLR|nr:hypothetical protein KSX_74680 [Ktedonospora formicarum]
MNLGNGNGNIRTGGWKSIRIFPDGKGWALTYHGLLHTNDRGKHWNSVTPWQPDTQSGIFTSGVNTFVDGNVAWITKPGNTTYQQYGKTNEPQLAQVYRTNNGGRTWNNAEIPDTASSYSDIRSGPGTIIGVLQTLGETRHQVSITALSATNETDAWISVKRFYTHTGGGHEEMQTEYTRVWHSSDGGKSWQLLVENKASQGSQIMLPGLWTAFPDKSTGIQNGLTYSNLVVSHDGGRSWQSQNLPSMDYASGASTQKEPIFFNAHYGIIPVQTLIAGHYTLFYYTTHDGAKTWQASPTLYLGNTNPQISYGDAQHWFILQKEILYITEDGGSYWTHMNPKIPGKAVINFSFTSNTEGWAITSKTDSQDYKTYTQDGSTFLLHTVDGGKTWQEVTYQLV